MLSVEATPASARRVKVLGVVLALLGVVWAASYIQVRMLEIELTRVAADKIEELAGPPEGRPFEVATPVITVSRPFVLFGKTTGKIAVYMRPMGGVREQEEDEHSTEQGHGHHHAGGISGVEYFLVREDGLWIERESGQCSSEQCQLEGAAAFKTGLHYPPER